jgi:addiction module HigA family antidote/deoxycytidine triphosphate deaminase
MATPGDRLRELISELGLDQIKLAEKLNVTRQTINNIVNDRHPISREMANKLARMTGHTPGYWMQFEFSETGTRETDPSTGRGAAILVDDQIRQALRQGVIAITPLDPDTQVQAASVDLTVGDQVLPAGGEVETLSAETPFILLPGRTVNLRTREALRLPGDHMARVGAIAKIARFGIITGHGLQVDPSYEGELEFCLFNAGVRGFEIRRGAPIISLEIVRLSAAHSNGKIAKQHSRNEVRDNFSLAAASLTLVRRWLASRIVTETAGGRFNARIPELKVDVWADAATAAAESAVTTALTAFHASCASASLREYNLACREFFARNAGRLFLTHDEARSVALAIGLGVERSFIVLRNREHLPLPQGGGEIALQSIAELLGEPVDELVLALTRSLPAELDASVTPLRAQTPRAWSA